MSPNCLIALTAVLVTAALRAPVPRSYDIGTTGDAYVTVNFYAPERDEVSGATFRAGVLRRCLRPIAVDTGSDACYIMSE